MSALLGAVGAGAGGYAQGKMQAQESQRQDRTTQMAELMQALQRRSMEREDEAAPPDFMRGLQSVAPGFQGLPGGNRRENLSAAGMYRAPGTTDAGKDYDRELELINARGAQARQTRGTAPGGDGPTREEIIMKYSGMLTTLDRIPEEMFGMLLQNDPRFAGMGANKAATRSFLLGRLREYGVDANGGQLGAPVKSAPTAAPARGAAPPVAPGRQKFDKDGNPI
jgi:hypothetical protein